MYTLYVGTSHMGRMLGFPYHSTPIIHTHCDTYGWVLGDTIPTLHFFKCACKSISHGALLQETASSHPLLSSAPRQREEPSSIELCSGRSSPLLSHALGKNPSPLSSALG